MGGSMTAQKPKMPGSMSTCVIPNSGTQTGTCPHQKVESSESPLCARHLLIAAMTVKSIGGHLLAEIVRREEEGR